MKIAYGTYAMPQQSWEEALTLLSEMGYDGVELFLGPDHNGAQAAALTPARRAALRQQLQSLGLATPAMMIAGSLYHAEPAGRATMRETMSQAAQIGHDLGLGTPPILAAGLGGRTGEWPSVRPALLDCLAEYAEWAESAGVLIAAEAHCGAAMDRSERIIDLLSTVDSPRVRCHFDIVHMFLAGEDEAAAVQAVLPYTAHTHITDTKRHADGHLDLRLLGDGDLDAAKYMKAMAAGGWDDCITLEVSRMLWGRPEYDWRQAAVRSRDALLAAFAAAGVARG